MVFSSFMYRKFIYASGVLFAIYAMLIINFTRSLMDISMFDFKNALEALSVMSNMTSDSSALNFLEVLLTFFLMIAFGVMILISNHIEAEIAILDK